jgi:glycosyltransferase involved in cell wall biosynthesis
MFAGWQRRLVDGWLHAGSSVKSNGAQVPGELRQGAATLRAAGCPPAWDQREHRVVQRVSGHIQPVHERLQIIWCLMEPKVSFIVPCYKLAHLLGDCVHSILRQSYTNFEVLIMDDSSPDHTPEVAQSFSDPRVRHIRNEKNLGNIGNYNRGIGLSRGRYVWLISADDYLRREYVLQRYVQVMESHPEVGYVFCPVIALENGQETGVMPNYAPFRSDVILRGREFLARLIQGCCVAAPAAIVRRECYEKVSMFPAHMPYAGDWYLWCAFAFRYDVAYVVEPMVIRRLHDQNLTKFFEGEGRRTHVANMLEVPWQMKYLAEATGADNLSRLCDEAVIAEYIAQLSPYSAQTGRPGMTWEEFETSLHDYTRSRAEATNIRARVLAGLGDHYYWDSHFPQAYEHYRRALQESPWMSGVYAKYALLWTGSLGTYLRRGLGAIRRGLSAPLAKMPKSS